MYNMNDRQSMREFYFSAWKKHQHAEKLEPLEEQVVQVILDHPEYHTILNHPENAEQDFDAGKNNPFLHMAMHLAIRDQLALNRPSGIREIYQGLMTNYHDALEVEHIMMTVLSHAIAEMLNKKSDFDDKRYLELLYAKIDL